jgi:hypothetical protein
LCGLSGNEGVGTKAECYLSKSVIHIGRFVRWNDEVESD